MNDFGEEKPSAFGKVKLYGFFKGGYSPLPKAIVKQELRWAEMSFIILARNQAGRFAFSEFIVKKATVGRALGCGRVHFLE